MTKHSVVEESPVTTKSPGPAGTSELARIRRLVEKAKHLPDIRADKVRQIRRLIALGRLETPERIEGAARKIAEELGL
jgi:hypothetical protein